MAEADFPLKIGVSVVDRMTAPIARINARVNRSLAPLRAINQRVRLLGEQAGLPKVANAFSGLVRGARDFRSELGRVSLRVVALGAAGGYVLKKFVFDFAAAGDHVAKQARRIGIGVEALQELRFAADRAGVESNVLDASLLAFTKRLGDAAAGRGEGLVWFEALGIQIRDSRGELRSVDEVLGDVVDRLGRLRDEQSRNAAAAGLFSEQGLKLTTMFAGGRRELEALRLEARRLGGVIPEDVTRDAEEFQDALTDLRFSLFGVRNVLGAELLPLGREWSGQLKEWLVGMRPQIRAWSEDFAAKLPERLRRLKEIGGQFLDTLRPMLRVGGRLVQAIGPGRAIAMGLAVVIGGPLLKGVIALTGALWKLGVAIVTTPVGTFLALLAAVGLAAYLIVKNWGPISDWFKRLWARMKDHAKPFFDWLDERVRSAFDQLDRLGEWLDENPVWRAVRGVLQAGPKVAPVLGWEDGLEPPAPPVSDDERRKTIERIYGVRQGSRSAETLRRPASPEQGGSRADINVRFENLPRGARTEVRTSPGAQLQVSRGWAMEGL